MPLKLIALDKEIDKQYDVICDKKAKKKDVKYYYGLLLERHMLEEEDAIQ